jgi:O-antigen/teichoic acid export membrane protein
MHLRYQLFRNSFTTLIQILATTIVSIVLPPILLSCLGMEGYGIWALIMLVNSYVALLDLGFQSGLIKLIAEAEVRKDTERILLLMNTSLWVYVGIFFLSCAVAFSEGGVLAKWLLNSLPDPSGYIRIFQTYLVISLSGLLTIPFSGLLKGFQRYDQSNALEIIAMLMNATSSVTLLLAGSGLWALVIGAAVAALWRVFAYLWLAWRAFPSFRLNWVSKGWLDTLKEMVRLSPADQSVRIYTVITQSVVRLAISAYAGVSFVGIYDIAKRIVNQVNGVSTIVFLPLVPAVSSLAAQGKKESLHELLRRCQLYLGMLGLPLTYFLLIFYDPVLSAWLGLSEVSFISFAGRLLLIATFAELFTGPTTTASLGLGTANLYVLKLLLTGILNVVLVLGLGQRFGFHGIVIGETVATLIGTFICILVFQRWFSIPAVQMTLEAIKRVSVATLPIWLLLTGVWLYFSGLPVWHSLLTWGGMLAMGLLATGLVYWFTGLLSRYEVDLALNAFALRRREVR